MGEVTNRATFVVLWHSQGAKDSSTSYLSGNAWTYKGNIPYGQEEIMWLLQFTSLTNSSRDTTAKLNVTATFINTLGETTRTDEFSMGKHVKYSFSHKLFVDYILFYLYWFCSFRCSKCSTLT